MTLPDVCKITAGFVSPEVSIVLRTLNLVTVGTLTFLLFARNRGVLYGEASRFLRRHLRGKPNPSGADRVASPWITATVWMAVFSLGWTIQYLFKWWAEATAFGGAHSAATSAFLCIPLVDSVRPEPMWLDCREAGLNVAWVLALHMGSTHLRTYSGAPRSVVDRAATWGIGCVTIAYAATLASHVDINNDRWSGLLSAASDVVATVAAATALYNYHRAFAAASSSRWWAREEGAFASPARISGALTLALFAYAFVQVFYSLAPISYIVSRGMEWKIEPLVLLASLPLKIPFLLSFTYVGFAARQVEQSDTLEHPVLLVEGRPTDGETRSEDAEWTVVRANAAGRRLLLGDSDALLSRPLQLFSSETMVKLGAHSPLPTRVVCLRDKAHRDKPRLFEVHSSPEDAANLGDGFIHVELRGFLTDMVLHHLANETKWFALLHTQGASKTELQYAAHALHNAADSVVRAARGLLGPLGTVSPDRLSASRFELLRAVQAVLDELADATSTRLEYQYRVEDDPTNLLRLLPAVTRLKINAPEGFDERVVGDEAILKLVLRECLTNALSRPLKNRSSAPPDEWWCGRARVVAGLLHRAVGSPRARFI